MTYYRMEVLRILRDPVTMFFAAVLPAFFYLLFGARSAYGEFPLGNGNVAMYTLIAMGAYGAATATTVVGGHAALERMQGWTRQLGLTPMPDSTFVTTKVAVAWTIAAVPVIVANLLGMVTLASAPWHVWVISALVAWAGSAIFALYGLVFGLALKSEASFSAASGSLVILGFLGNVFMPLSGIMLDIARFTPLYGVVALARYPLTGSQGVNLESGEAFTEPWQPMVANVVVWTIALAVLATWLVRRARAR
ncbi:MAG: ABC transporter permease [Arachnia sp.]